MENFVKRLAKKWPSSEVARCEIGRFSGGTIAPRTIANLDSQGAGPRGRYKVGRKVVYPVSEVIRWLESRYQSLD